MKNLQARLRRLEARYGTTAPRPWETPGWAQWSEADQVRAVEQYIATSPDSVIARQWRALEALSDAELEALLAAAHAQLGETP